MALLTWQGLPSCSGHRGTGKKDDFIPRQLRLSPSALDLPHTHASVLSRAAAWFQRRICFPSLRLTFSSYERRHTLYISAQPLQSTSIDTSTGIGTDASLETSLFHAFTHHPTRYLWPSDRYASDISHPQRYSPPIILLACRWSDPRSLIALLPSVEHHPVSFRARGRPLLSKLASQRFDSTRVCQVQSRPPLASRGLSEAYRVHPKFSS